LPRHSTSNPPACQHYPRIHPVPVPAFLPAEPHP